MIQFNLLPEVKLEYIKAERMRRLITVVAVLVSVVFLAGLGLLITINQLGKQHLADLSRDITSKSSELQKEPKLNYILTVQNQLASLSALHGGKPAVSRLFDYLNSLTPSQISITNYTSDFTAHTITITGTADALSSVNQYVDTLKYTTYAVQSDTTNPKKPAFSNIVLSSFGLSPNATQPNQAATYTISLGYDPVIFDITKNVKLTIPNLVTTRSSATQASDLFTAVPAPATTVNPTGTR
jgi:Tfp pilus assembly protein PilN